MLRLIFLASVMSIWFLVSAFKIWPDFYLPSPLAVIESFRLSILFGASLTLARTLVSFFIGVFAAYLVAYFAYMFRLIDFLDEQASASRAVPMVAAMPLFILWFGFNEYARLAVISLTSLVFVTGPLAEAIRGLPRELTIIKSRLNRSASWSFLWIVMPGTLGGMIGPLRVGLAISFTIAVAVDFMGASAGLGKLIDSARVTFNLPAVFLLLIISALIGLSLDSLLKSALRKITHWVGSTAKG